MRTLTIDDTIYNLAFLVSVKYKAKTKVVARRDAKSDGIEPSGTLKSASSLDLKFLDCDTVHLKKDKADEAWNTLSILMNLNPTESISTADESHPS